MQLTNFKIYALAIAAMLLSHANARADVEHLMPTPHVVNVTEGVSFALDRAVRLSDPTDCEWLRETLTEIGLTVSNDAHAAVTVTVVNSIEGAFNHNVPDYPDEAYRLEVTPQSIDIKVLTPTGTIRAAQTLSQLALDTDGALPAVDITDWPAFKVRGFMHDVGRSFLSIEELKQQIDLLSRFKINTFHWHLTDYTGWRLEIKAYPELTGSKAITRFPGKYYTQQEAKDLQDYAATRGMVIIPEIDMPGHSHPFENAMGHNMLHSSAKAELKTILGEVAALFDKAPYIHIGGDEISFDDSFLIEMIAHVHSLGKKVVIWNKYNSPARSINLNTIKADMCTNWATSGTLTPGIPNIDMRYNYTNHFDVFADVVGIFKSNIFYETQGNDNVGGTISAAWNDTMTPTGDDIVRMNNVYANVLASGERAWCGGGKQYIETGGTVLPNSGDEFEEFADWERRFIYHKNTTLAAAKSKIPYVKQTNVRWRVTEQIPNGGNPAKALAPESYIGADQIPTSFTVDGKTYSSSIMTGAGIYLRHIWHNTVKGNYDNPQAGNTAYAWTEIYSPEEQDAGAYIEFYTYSRSGNEKAPSAGNWDRRGSRVWLNGQEIAAPQWQQPDADITQNHNTAGLTNENFTARPVTPIHLEKGWNRVFLKLPYANNGGTKRDKWQFTFVVTDSDGNDALDGIVYSPSKNLDGAESAPTKTLVFDLGEDGSRFYRIPAIETAADGSLVVLADKRGSSIGDLPNTISIVSKRSTDNGLSWSDAVTVAQGNSATSKTYGDPAIVLDRTTGNLVAVFAGDTGFFTSTPTRRAGIYVSISEDNGVTWSEPRSITDQIYQSNWHGAFVASGRMLQTKDGRILCVANARLTASQGLTDIYEFVCCSSDGGLTWEVLNPDGRVPAAGDGNESKLIETSDGTLIMSIRSNGHRRFAKSTDGGRTWSEAVAMLSLTEPSCNGDIMVYPSTDGQTRMLHSLPANATSRRDVSISMSYDEGETWPVKKLLIDNASAYSALTVLPDGSIGCLVEEGPGDSVGGFQIYFVRFGLDWLTDGADNPEVTDNIFDGTLNCDGTRYMKIPHSADFDIPAGGQMTVSAKIKLGAYGVHRGIVNNRSHSATSSSTGNGSTTGFDMFGGFAADNSFSNNVNMNKGSWNNIGHVWCNTIALDTWHTVTWVMDGANGVSKLYIDGQLKDTRSGSDLRNYPINPQVDMLVGARYDLNTYPCTVNSGWHWLGNIDDVRFYSKALSQEEVTADMTSIVDSSTPDLIAAYDFAEVKGSTVTDISGNGHDGTLVGFPENRAGYAVTYLTPAHGTFELRNGETVVLSGQKVEAGTELTVVASPDEGYMTGEITVNGTPLSGNTFTVNEKTVVEVTFVRDPDAPVTYREPSGSTRANTYVEHIGTEGATTDIDVSYNSVPTNVYTLVEPVVVSAPGQQFALKLDAYSLGDGSNSTVRQDLRYSAAYLFTDWYGTADFEFVTSYGLTPPSHNVYGNYDEVMNISRNLTMPSDVEPGKTARVRVLYSNAWNVPGSSASMPSGTPHSQADPNSAYVVDGVAYDILVKADPTGAITGIGSDRPDSPVEYYNLQGTKMPSGRLLPGIYIRRQGSKAEKVLITY